MTDLDADERYSTPPYRPVPRPPRWPIVLAIACGAVILAVVFALSLDGCAGSYSLHEPPKGNTPSSRCTMLAAWRTGATIAASVLGAGATAVAPIEAALPATDTADRTGLAVGAGISGALAGVATAIATGAETAFSSDCATATTSSAVTASPAPSRAP